MLFHHGGFDPPDRTHLFSPDLAAQIATGPAADRRTALEKNTGIRLENILFSDNDFTNVQYRLGYRSEPGYGAKSSGWEGVLDLSDLATTLDSPPTPGAAASFFITPLREAFQKNSTHLK